jgi:hypothetical protein
LGLGFCPSAWVCELYVGGNNPGFAIMGVGGSDLSGVGYAVMDMVVYNGRLYVAPVLVVVVGRVYMYNGVGGGWFGSWGFIMVKLGVACLGCIKLGSSNVGIGRGLWISVEGAVCVAWFSFDWRLFMAALGGGMAGGFMPTWMWAATILQSLGSMSTHLYAYRFRDGIRRGATGAGVCGLWRYIRAGCLWGITTEGVELCWRSA